MFDAVRYFVDGGRGLPCNIGDHPFELYLHTSDPYRGSGRTWWNGMLYWIVCERGTSMSAGSGFDRSDQIGFWDMAHDCWLDTLRIGVEPSYVSAGDVVAHNTWIDPGASP